MSLLDAEALKTVDIETYRRKPEGFLTRGNLREGEQYIGRIMLEPPTDERYASDFLLVVRGIIPVGRRLNVVNRPADIADVSLSHVSLDGQIRDEVHHRSMDIIGKLMEPTSAALYGSSVVMHHHEIGYLRSVDDEVDRALRQLLGDRRDPPVAAPSGRVLEPA